MLTWLCKLASGEIVMLRTLPVTLLSLVAITFWSPATTADDCGYKADGNYHCGTNCGYKADGNFHCGTNCGYKADGKFHCDGDG
jgi:hypothetical protein